jgi:hypothetical protein
LGGFLNSAIGIGKTSSNEAHASAYTAVLFLAGIFGERPKSGKEVILATQRALEQQALER